MFTQGEPLLQVSHYCTARARVFVKTPLNNRSLAVAARKVLLLALESKPSRAREQAVFESSHRLVSQRNVSIHTLLTATDKKPE